MTFSYLVVFLLGMLVSCWRDRKDLKQAKRSEIAIYWSLATLTLFCFFSSYINLHIPMPTEIIAHRFAPWFHQFTKI
ncbi:hypothetical protein [Tumebacillus permanentifrigoris]|uniref:Uncharacterized protein n=1 Tax=Tumebacillus permanentifrigoris TaxID=378543 RepID=A0A316DDS8_9BACL|nr:hypothetical protein [Tumebacillus permanentifrigoris]PWK16387.1 hypothetical protein C7459_101251 [Tumebacillus permanentifrigoris]